MATTFNKFVNNTYATLSSSYTAGAGSLVLQTGQGTQFGSTFPIEVTVITAASYRSLTEVYAIYTVTGRSTDTLTGVAVAEGTTDQSFAINAVVEMRFTAGSANAISTAINALQNVTMPANTISGNPTGSTAAPSNISLYPNMAMVGSTTLRSRVPIAAITTAGTAIANTLTQTSCFTGATIVGSLTIPANTLQVGSVLRFEVFGTYSVTGTPSLQVEYMIGGTNLSTYAQPMSAQTGAGWNTFCGSAGSLVVQSITGSSGTIMGYMGILLAGIVNTGMPSGSTASNVIAPVAVTINTTGTLALDLLFKWSVASASNTIQLQGGAIFLD